MKEPKGKGKAEVEVRAQLETACNMRDWAWAQRVFERYGNYLLLIDPTIAGEARVYVR